MRLNDVVLVGVLCLAAAFSGCSQREEQSAPAAGAPAPASAHGPTTAADAGKGGELQFVAPPEWTAETPSSSMRKAQYRLPRAEGDPEDAELVVFYFQGSGGGVQANIDRWIGQFSKPDGSPATDTATTRKREVGGLQVSVVDVSGTYHASSGMMLQDTKDKKDFRMLAAVAETPSGPWFFKLTGPAKTIAKWEGSFDDFLGTLKH